ncbi:magnesium transporter CorA family protein [Marinivivus vitaminiproducens]|uniref:magnesium transporter CorA family protein n=1 Tax=Marinivivus vitaminiproducens TaxID=3035935 RepID=UPI0027AB10B9|nr:magnesium transporter CorA family protein [Geminicoccaceae bacterium SCSIO 64248]
MIQAFSERAGSLVRRDADGDRQAVEQASWLDLAWPTDDEERLVEQVVGHELPTREEMAEIEASSRMYTEDGAWYLTAMLLTRADTDAPEITPVTFVLTPDRLVTIRYTEPKAFAVFAKRAEKAGAVPCMRHDQIMMGLFESVIDRLADVIERIGSEVDVISKAIFETSANRASVSRRLEDVVFRLGRQGDLLSKARESLASMTRVVIFIDQALREREGQELRKRLKIAGRDLQSLVDHASFLSGKMEFLLDATLGLISIQQNNVITIFSVAAVVFLPPTLIASIYGMNFDVMPELHASLGYPLALGAMVVSALVPFLYFKKRGWL